MTPLKIKVNGRTYNRIIVRNEDTMDYPYYSDVPKDGTVPYEYVEPLFQCEIYVDSNEKYMYQYCWKHLGKAGLLNYHNIEEYYTIPIYALSLIYLFNNFCYIANYGGAFSEFDFLSVFDDFLPELVIGELHGRLIGHMQDKPYTSGYEITDNMDSALSDLVGEHYYKITNTLVPINHCDYFLAMYCANWEPPDCALPKVHNLAEYEAMMNQYGETIYCNLSYEEEMALGWLQAGGGAVDA